MNAAFASGYSTLEYRDPIYATPTLEPPQQATVLEEFGELLYTARSILHGIFSAKPSQSSVADVFEIYDLSIQDAVARPQISALVREILDLTQWSHRRFAQVLEVTHPTVTAMLRGESGVLLRSPAKQGLLADLHQLVLRVAPLAARKGYDLGEVLERSPSGDELSALDLLRSREFGRAYVTAMDVITPRQATKFMTGSYPARAGRSSLDLTE